MADNLTINDSTTTNSKGPDGTVFSLQQQTDLSLRQNVRVVDGTKDSSTALTIGANGGVKVEGVASGTPVPVSGTFFQAIQPVSVASGQEVDGHSATIGITSGAAVVTDASGTLQQYLRGLVKLISGILSVKIDQTTPGTTNLVRAGSTTTPSWTDGVAVTAIATLAKGAVSRSTIDLTGKHGMYLTMFIGRTGTTALDVGIAVRVNRQLATSPIIKTPGAPVFSATSDIAAAVSGVAAGSGNNAGVTSLTLNAAKTFVAGTSGDIILAVLDSASVPTTASEFVRQSFATSTTVKLLDAPTISAHNNTAHVVSDKSNVWQAWIEGGGVTEVIFDYGAATTGDTVVIGAYAQRLDSMVAA